MMRWCRIGSLTLLFLFLISHSIYAYERDVHYDLTKYLARWAAFSEDEAEQVATADQEIDAKPEFNPLPNPNFCPELRKIAGPASAIVAMPVACKNDPEFQRMVTAQRAYHFVDSERLRALRESAFQGRNLKTLGHYLHALQDTFAHSLMDYADLPPLDKLVANLGRLPDEKIIGHLLYGHSLDKSYERPDLAELMARYVYAELVRFKGSVDRWNELEATVARFVREKDLQRQARYLSASSPPSPPVASPQPSDLATKAQEPMHEGRTFVEWQADLRDSSPTVREKAALALGNFGATAVPILTQTLRDSDANVRWAAANALGEIGRAAKGAVPALVQALKDSEAIVRQRAEIALRQIDQTALIAWQRAEREKAQVQWEAAQRPAEALAKADPPSQNQVLALVDTLTSSKNPRVRAEAAKRLGMMRAEARDAVPALEQALKDWDRYDAWEARRALRLIKFPNSPPRLCAEEVLTGSFTQTGGWEGFFALQSGEGQKPCPKEGDEEKKAAANQLNVAFTRKHGVRESVACEALSRNPFAYEGKVIALSDLTFEQMIARDRGLLGVGDAFEACGVAVSGIPHGVFSIQRVRVVLAGRVLGNTEVKIGPATMKVPHLHYVGVHICNEADCADFFGPASMRK